MRKLKPDEPKFYELNAINQKKMDDYSVMKGRWVRTTDGLPFLNEVVLVLLDYDGHLAMAKRLERATPNEVSAEWYWQAFDELGEAEHDMAGVVTDWIRVERPVRDVDGN